MLVETTMSKLLKAYDRSRVPLYIQVASVMRQRIEAEQWRPGQKISTLVELEKEFQVARVTVRQAIDILREEGLLNCQQGRGTFVEEKSPNRHWLKLATSWDMLNRFDQGQRPEADQGRQSQAVSEPEGRRRRACAEICLPAKRPVQGRRALRPRQSAPGQRYLRPRAERSSPSAPRYPFSRA